MITSRETRRWILPKGRPEKRRKAWQVAAQEAYEEAGVTGRLAAKAIGAFPSAKRLASGIEIPCTVRVFLMLVERELDDWPERVERERRWLSVAEAAAIAVNSEEGLYAFLHAFAGLWVEGAVTC